MLSTVDFCCISIVRRFDPKIFKIRSLVDIVSVEFECATLVVKTKHQFQNTQNEPYNLLNCKFNRNIWPYNADVKKILHEHKFLFPSFEFNFI